MLARASIQVFSIGDQDWKCRINEGIASLISAKWCPDSRNVIYIINHSFFVIYLFIYLFIFCKDNCGI